MNSKKLVDQIGRLVKAQVASELKRQRPLMRAEIIGEVAKMLDYTERKILSEIGGSSLVEQTQPQYVEERQKSSFEKALENMNSMPNYKGVEKVEVPDRQFTQNSMLNSILNETTPLRETRQVSSIVDSFEPISAPQSHAAAPQQASIPKSGTIQGIDGKPVDLSKPSVQKVLDVLMNTNFKEKFDRISEAGDKFRDAGSSAPRYNTEYFDKATVGN